MNVRYSKSKQARRIVLDDYFRAFTTKFYELEAYVDQLLRSNPGSIVNVETCRDDLKEERRIFVCLNACKKGWKVGRRPIIGLNGFFFLRLSLRVNFWLL